MINLSKTATGVKLESTVTRDSVEFKGRYSGARYESETGVLYVSVTDPDTGVMAIHTYSETETPAGNLAQQMVTLVNRCNSGYLLEGVLRVDNSGVYVSPVISKYESADKYLIRSVKETENGDVRIEGFGCDEPFVNRKITQFDSPLDSRTYTAVTVKESRTSHFSSQQVLPEEILKVLVQLYPQGIPDTVHVKEWDLTESQIRILGIPELEVFWIQLDDAIKTVQKFFRDMELYQLADGLLMWSNRGVIRIDSETGKLVAWDRGEFKVIHSSPAIKYGESYVLKRIGDK